MGAPNQFGDELEVFGHIKNSQTRAILSILSAAKIQHKFNRVEAPKKKLTNMQGTQGQENSESVLLKTKQYPMITHNGYKILSDMTKFVYYICEQFPAEL